MPTDDAQHWISLTVDEGSAVRQEAAREIAEGHQLYGLTMEAEARCGDCGAVAFRIEDGTFALVRLTQSERPEAPPMPATTRSHSRIDFELAMARHEHEGSAERG